MRGEGSERKGRKERGRDKKTNRRRWEEKEKVGKEKRKEGEMRAIREEDARTLLGGGKERK